MLKKIAVVLLIFALIIMVLGIVSYNLIWSDNIHDTEGKKIVLFIPTGGNYDNVLDSLHHYDVLNNYSSFNMVSERLGYPNLIKPGRYIIEKNMNNWTLVRKLRSGDQDAVRLTINNITQLSDLTKKVADKLEFSNEDLENIVLSDTFLKKNGLTKDNVLTLFISNTYEVWWNTSAEKFMAKMSAEHDKFWTPERRKKAATLPLSLEQVVTLASIVQKESNKADEQPRIAGVYLNRLRDNWPLQADPTVKFALKQFDLKRILNVHTQYDSPFNTYRNVGLPPGPICLPEMNVIDAVLNAEQHNYFYFCAKEDFSGYHSFATTLAEHNANAQRYQAALNKAGY